LKKSYVEMCFLRIHHTRGGQLILTWSHFEKAAISGGPQLLETETNLGSS